MRRVFPLRQTDNCGYADTEDSVHRGFEQIEEPVKRINEHRHALANSEKVKKLSNSCDWSTISGDENLNNINSNEVTVARPPSHQKPPRASAYPIFTAGGSHRYTSSHSSAPGKQKLNMEKQRAMSFSSNSSYDSQTKLAKETDPSKQRIQVQRPLSAPKNRPFSDTYSRQNSFRSNSLRYTQLPDSVKTLLGGVNVHEGFDRAVAGRPCDESLLHTRSFSQSTSEASLSESSDFSSCFTKDTASSESSTSKKSSVGGRPGRGSSPFKYLSARMVAEKLVKVLGKEKLKPQLDRPISCELLPERKGESSCARGKEQGAHTKKEISKHDLVFKQSSLGSPFNSVKNASELSVIVSPNVNNASNRNLRQGNHQKVEIAFDDQRSLEARAVAREELALSLDKESTLWEAKYWSNDLEDYVAEATVHDFNNLKYEIRKLRKEKKELALELAQEIRARISEQNVAVDQLRHMKIETEGKVSAIEKDKDSVQESLEKELERRANEWAAKLEKMKAEEKKLRERVKDLAEDKAELQKVVSSFKEKEADWRMESAQFESHISTLKQRLKASDIEMARQMHASAGTLERIKASDDELETLAQRNSYLEIENSEIQKEMTRLRRICNDQEMTIEGLWQELDEAVNGSFDCRSESLLRLQRELLRLAGVEQELRSEITVVHAELTHLKQERKATHAGIPAEILKLNHELQDGVDKLQSRAVDLQEENKKLTLSLRAAIRARRDAERTLKLFQLKEVNQAGENLIAADTMHDKKGTLEGKNSSKDIVLEEYLKVLNSKLQLRETELKRLDEEILEILNSRESLQMEVDDLHEKLLIANQRIRELEREGDKKEIALEVLRTDAESHSKELTNLQNELSVSRGQREELQKEAEDMSKEALRLTLELNATKKAVEKLEEEVMLKEGQISILRGTYTNCDCLS
ncbi:hypothetical protein GOP47_0021852 [Adiantum capillus-veneris]|uniref:Uncharacterized protein n=1 Tax=Adiantum capillus-veneris TaxID=13818 RepID=A0A9D4U8H7_ADICA|nr:hypothetical protein GOP47_0021852 [Adiantum capillus-veneris]